MANGSGNGGRGGNGSGHGLLFWVVLILVIAAVSGVTFAQDLLKESFSVLKIIGIGLLVIVALAIAAGVTIAIYSERKEKKLKEEQLKLEILNTPLETFGESETQQLMDKYDGKEPSGQKEQQAGPVNPYSAKNPYGREGQKQTGR